MKKILTFPLALCMSFIVHAQVSPDYNLPDNISHKGDIPAPDKFAGHYIGEWHLTHDRLYYYMLELARSSDRAIWEEYGRSHEGRPLGHLIISSPENIKNLEQIRKQHVMLCDPQVSNSADITKMPLIVKLGYGIHGNESSAQNASSLVAWHLTSGEGPYIDELLKNTIILIDPALNPDGMQRHSAWVNFTKSMNNNPDANSWEFSEPWPGGRTNHYWFDLNRDYIMLQQPESTGRVAAFHKWKPNINTDHHEMESSRTFFFQPGIQSRNNPLTPLENQDLTAEIGKFHEKFLNDIGSLYYTEESFDDFYVGKGSSYPDIHGSVGILFEQAGVRGHLRETPGGTISFPFSIRNQVTVSLSTLEAGLKMKDKLLESQRKFYKEALLLADKHPVKAYIFSEPADNGRVSEFIDILLQHQIRVYRTSKDLSRNGMQFRAEESYIVPLKQNEYRFIRSLFDPVKEFTDSLFYDVSTWVLPMSFNIPYTGITNLKEMESVRGEEILTPPVKAGRISGSTDPYAYLFEWDEYFAPAALLAVQNAGLKARVASGKFSLSDVEGVRDFSYGTIMIPVSGQSISPDEIQSLMRKVSEEWKIDIYTAATGLTTSGIDLGSNEFVVLQKPSVLMVTGDGASSADAGEIWHLFDTRFSIPVTMVTASRLSTINIDRYNVLIITGSPAIASTGIENIRTWNRNGGTIIGYKGGNNWLTRNKFAEIEFKPAASSGLKEGTYKNRSSDNQAYQIPGSIFEVKMDLTHPLCYGYDREFLPVFKSGTMAAVKSSNIYNNPLVYTEAPLLSGYCNQKNIERIKGSAFASIHGRRVISIYDNTNFRAIWYGTNKIFLNAVFFGQIL